MKITKPFALLVVLALTTGDVVAQCSIPAFGVPVKTGDYTAIAENNGKLLVSRKRRPIRRAFSGPTAVEKWLHSAILSDPRDSHSRNNKASVSFQFLGSFCCGNILGWFESGAGLASSPFNDKLRYWHGDMALDRFP